MNALKKYLDSKGCSSRIGSMAIKIAKNVVTYSSQFSVLGEMPSAIGPRRSRNHDADRLQGMAAS
jgi:hypothetical protein